MKIAPNVPCGINEIAPIATSFFCLSYSTVNLCCLLLCVSGVTNFRPLFKYFSKWSALIGLIMNIIIMFYVDFKFASVSLICAVLIFIYLIYRNAKSKNDWGDVGQSVIYHQLRKYMLKLNRKNLDHSKLWRPQILLFVDNHEIALVDFCNSLKKGGIYIIGSVLNAQYMDKYYDLNKEWIRFIHRNKIKAFPQISMAPEMQQLLGYQNLLSLAGLGPMKPNTVVLPLCKLEIDRKRTLDRDRKLSAYSKIDDDIGTDEEDENVQIVFDSPNLMDYDNYMELLHNIGSMKKNIILTTNFEYLNYNLIVSSAIQSKFNIKTPDIEVEVKGKDGKISKKRKKSPREYVSPLFGPHSIIELKKEPKRRRRMTLPDDTDNKWIDVWIFTQKYSFDIEDMEDTNPMTGKKIENNFDFVFPQLMLQFAHILSINKVWKTKANVRILLLCPRHEWDEDEDIWINYNKQRKFNEILTKLRLKRYITMIEHLVLPLTESLDNKPKVRSNIISGILGAGKQLNELKDDNDSVYDTSERDRDSVYDTDPEEEKDEYDGSSRNIIEQRRMGKYYNEINDIILNHSDETYFTFISLPDLDDTLNEKVYIENLHILTENLPPTALIKCGQQFPVISLDI